MRQPISVIIMMTSSQMETFSTLLAICAGNSPHKGQWRGALMFSLICAWIKGWVKKREAGDLRRHRTHYDVIVLMMQMSWCRIETPGYHSTWPPFLDSKNCAFIDTLWIAHFSNLTPLSTHRVLTMFIRLWSKVFIKAFVQYPFSMCGMNHIAQCTYRVN